MKQQLINYRNAAAKELTGILDYWMQAAIDHQHDGFVGRIDGDNAVQENAPKGSVLNSRILWTFSAAYLHSSNPLHLAAATKAYNYIIHHFLDVEYGGIYWTVSADGKPLETKKQVYAIAFALYGVTEFYKATRREDVKEIALTLYQTLLDHGYDKHYGGYVEAFTRDWKELPDQRLSAKDANERKSMNTNLHVLEAYANLYRTWPDDDLKKQIADLLHIFSEKIIDRSSGHMQLFFNDEWKVKPDVISFGHDIEASWLLYECARAIGDEALIKKWKQEALTLAHAATRGLDSDGGLWYEYDPVKKIMFKTKHWWPQAEAMVGFLNAWQLTNDDEYLNTSLNVWKFIDSKILDKKYGEWYWGIDETGTVMQGEDKVGLWKCPYHNSRACLEIINRLNKII